MQCTFDKKHTNIIILKHERESFNKSVLVNVQVYTVHCFVYQNPKVPKWRRVGSSKIYFPYLDSSEGGFKNSNCLKTGAVTKILPLDVSPQGLPVQ